MHRSLIAVVGATLLSFVLLGAGQGIPLPTPCATRAQASGRFDQATRNWIFHFWRSHRTPRVFVHAPKPSTDPIASLVVTTDLPSARRVLIDVDLNHDDRFTSAGELGYAEAEFDPSGRANMRLHGLVHGAYRVRARAMLADGSVVASAVEELVVLPSPSGYLPVAFEPNRGQTDEAVLFLARAKNQMVYITRDGTVLVSGGRVTRFRLAGANSFAHPVGAKKLPGISNYFLGNDPSKWRTEIETYRELVTREVYPGIDLVYHSNRGRLEYDFHVAPGADPSLICLEFPDAVDLSIDADGKLIARQADGREVRKSAPILYQTRHDGQCEGVKGTWVLKGRQQAGYRVADYDRRRALIIDPLIFSTYYGGTGNDLGWAIAVDAAGNSYVTGNVASANFPVTPGAFQTTFGGGAGNDIGIVKLNPTGTVVLYATYLGGNQDDDGAAIAVDAAGNVYLTGQTNGNFPVTAGVFQTTPQGSSDVYVTKLNPTGSALVYSTYLGGANAETGQGIAVDAAGNAYVAGRTSSNAFPTTAGAFNTTFSGGPPDAFITKLNPSGTALVYSTYLGGSAGGSQDVGRAIAVDAAGNAYVTGDTSSSDFPTTAGSYQPALAGGTDAFVTKLNPAGSALLFSTFLGGAANDFGNGIAVDAAGNIHVAGSTASNNFPTTPGAYQTVQPGGGLDGFVAKLNPAGNVLLYSTYLGGAGGMDVARSIAIDAAGNAYVAGDTAAANFPTVNPLQAALAGGANDAFVTVVNPTGTALVFSTYLGGAGSDSANGIAIDASGAMYVVGTTTSINFPTTVPIQAANAGAQDLFITKLTTAAPPPPPVPNPLPGVLYGITNFNQLITINTTTGAGTLVGPLSTGMNPTGLGFRGTSLYAWDTVTNRVQQLNPATAATVATIDIGIVASTGGDFTFRSDGIGFTTAATPVSTFWRFDVTVPNSSVIVTPIVPNMYGLAFNPAGVLYGLRQNGAELYTINTATGATSLVGPTGLPVLATGALGCDASGNLFAAMGAAGPASLYRIDPATGTPTLIGNIGFNQVAGITFAPGGAPPVPPAPPGQSPGEGTYGGSRGAPQLGNEGCYGFGGGMRTLPILRGPTPTDSGLMVRNVAHQEADGSSNGDFVWVSLAWATLAGLAFGATGIWATRFRPCSVSRWIE